MVFSEQADCIKQNYKRGYSKVNGLLCNQSPGFGAATTCCPDAATLNPLLPPKGPFGQHVFPLNAFSSTFP